jgi:SAM-dependent methyltransferase
MDILALPEKNYDVIVGNAVTYFFTPEQYESAVASISRSLAPGGYFLSFEFLHPFQQYLHIVEKSRSHPDGIDIYFRPFAEVELVFKRYGFERINFHPFSIPIDLVRGITYTENKTGFEDLNSYTVRTDTGDRILFRGTLAQPWCHLVARKTE